MKSCNTTYIVEYTDTFGGEANYSWVRRAEIEAPHHVTNRMIMKRARRALGLEGIRGRIIGIYGDTLEFRPYNTCTVLFIYPNYD